MRSQIVLCLFVGLAFASQTPAWRESTEYSYQVRARTLTSLHEVANDYSGILLKAILTIRPQSNGVLQGQISEPQYAEVHTSLPLGWESEIADSQLAYRPLEISRKPFQIVMKNSAVRDLIVEKDISNWEANIIKGFVSQFQLDTQAENLIPSHLNILTQEETNSAVFKTMEETVTGISETLYEIHPLAEYVLPSKPWLVQHPEKEDKQIIEIVKSKNYTRSEERPSYHYGFDGMNQQAEPSANRMGSEVTRSTVTRAVVTGDVKRHTVHSSVTVDQIIVSPNAASQQRGSVNTMLNVTLLSVQKLSEQPQQLSNPISLGSLVYRYDNPFGSDNTARPGKQHEHQADQPSSEYSSLFNEAQSLEEPSQRLKRSTVQPRIALSYGFNFSPDNSFSSEEEYWQQEQPRLNQAPESPLLPLYVGFKGQSIKKELNVVEKARKYAQEIAQEFERKEQMPEKNTAGKFVMLATLLRIMDQNEMEQVASQLYSQSKGESEESAWIAFRDAMAQAGTGPALLNIRDWIKTKKIQGYEAAEIVRTAAESARQPTEEYMRAFYQMIISPEVMEQGHLYEVSLLSYTRLAHQVYVNKYDSHNKYPVHSFGHFNTRGGRSFLRKEVIPQLTQKLHQAISKGETKEIHTYIRVLGNLGHQQILEAFEPYLEGQKQASQFQRLLMVIALDKFAQSSPKIARSVMYKIYQNPSEDEQVRAAAVFQLMRTNPPADMLQRMAVYTNTDPSSNVNAAVKSVILSASELTFPEHQSLREAAQVARPYLTTQQYGAQFSRNHLRSYVVKHMEFSYKQSAQFFGNDDSLIPTGLKYSLRKRLSGIREPVTSIQAMVSSIDDLIDVLEQQTEEYKQQQQQKQAQNPQSKQWSSESIAKLLNIQYEQREQLEGNLYFDMDILQKIFSFDNQTIEKLPQVLQHLEQVLKSGEHYQYKKMINSEERAIAYPTSLGLPFFFTYDEPILVSLEGKMRAVSSPQISNGKTLNKPDNIEAEFELRALFSGKSQSQFGFIAPFNHQRYSAGYDKNFHTFVPLSGKVQVDLKKMQLRAEVAQLEQENKLGFHFSSWPYTSKDDILSTQPNRKVIAETYPQKVDRVYGQKHTGIAFHVEVTSDKHMDFAWVYDRLSHHDHISAMLSPWLDDEMRHTIIDIHVDSQKSSTNKVVAQFGYQHKYQSRRSSENTESVDLSKVDSIPEESLKRQREFMKRTSADITNAHSRVYDASIEFQGQDKIKYTTIVAYSKSNIDPKARLLLQMRRIRQGQQLQFALSAKSHIPNTNGLDLTAAMELDPTTTTQVQAFFGPSYEQSIKINAQVQQRKSEERKRYLMEQPEYKECQRQMQEGNHQLPACAKMTAAANLLDRVSIKLDYDQNLSQGILDETFKVYSKLRHFFYEKVEEDLEGTKENRVDIEGRFNPDLEAVNVTLKTEHYSADFQNIRLNEWATAFLVPHPVFHLRSRLMGQAYGYDVYRPYCTIDKTAANTFDNKTYPVTMEKEWTVLLQYVPRRPSQQENQPQAQLAAEDQLKDQVESYVVLARASEKGSAQQKDIKMVIQSYGTEGKVVEIEMKPSQQWPKLSINGEEIKYSAQEGADIFDGYLQVYGLPNGEVKAELHKAFYVIYDGSRVKLTIVDPKFRDASRGLCGTFTGQPETDFLAPNNCILRKPEEFVASYTVLQAGQENQKISELKAQVEQQQCRQKKVVTVNVISSSDSGRMTSDNGNRRLHSAKSCTKLQTQYSQDSNGEICFTLRPLPVCNKGCQRRGSIVKNVPVHCVQSTSATNLWKTEIDKGASPDFSLKHESKSIRMEIPQMCVA